MSLLPEIPIAISPSLAATLGLEEAAMVAVLQDCMRHSELQIQRQQQWLTIGKDKLLSLTPFWSDADIQRILHNLRDKGLLHLDSPPLTQANFIRVAFDVPAPRQESMPQPPQLNTIPANQGLGGNRLIPPN